MTHAHSHHFPVERLHLLKSEDRLRLLPPEPILRDAGIGRGETVIDAGAGAGFWTLPASRLVGPEGRVLAVDIEPIMFAELRDLIAREALRNVEVVEAEELRIPLDDAIGDAAILGCMLHEPADPPAFLREVARLLRPRGRVLVVDWHKRPTEQGPPLEHRLSAEEVRAMLEGEGFAAETLPSPSDDFYVLLGRRG